MDDITDDREPEIPTYETDTEYHDPSGVIPF